MFCDLVGSTEMSVTLDPEDTRAIIKGYQEAATSEVFRFGGHVAQYTGDGILAYFGYPTAFEDSAARAVGAALAIVESIQRSNATTRRPGQPDLPVRIGVHTGVVVVSEMGGGARTERLAVGDTPNIAARVQAIAEPNTVVVSEVTAGLIARRFHTQPMGSHALKGVPTPMPIFRVLQAFDVLNESHRVATTPLVDRSPERARLVRAWASARGGQGASILVTGDGGIGKSRVVQFLKDHADAGGSHARLELRCQAMYRESAFHPFVEHLSSMAGFAPGDPGRVRFEKFARLLEARAPELRSDLAALCALLLVPTPADVEPVDPMALRGRIEGALERYCLAHISTPLLLVIEDLHWADSATLDVVRRLASAAPSRGMLTLLTARPDFEVPSGWESLVAALPLQPLPPEFIREIVGNMVGGDSLPASVLDQLLERIEGVPIYAEELTKSVVAAVAAPATAPDARHTTEFAIPATLQDSLMARLDRLGPIRATAQMGAVIGRQFDYHTLLALSRSDEVSLQRALIKLTDSDVLIQSGALPNARYSFRHALLHEATYGALLRDARHELHAEVGRILERQAAGDGVADDERVLQLAFHWDRAVPAHGASTAVLDKAATYATRAGEHQLMVSGYRESESYFTRALQHVAALPAGRRRDELELLARVRLATVHRATVGPASEQVRVELSRCRELCLQLGDRPELGAVLYGFWQLHLFRAQYPTALTFAEECQAEAIRSGDEDLRIQSHVALANTQFWLADFDGALENSLAALARYDMAKHARHAVSFGMDPGVLALMFASWIPQLRGQQVAAHTRHDELQRLTLALDHPLSRALALNTSCCYFVNHGDVGGALEAGQSLLSLAQAHGLFVYALFGTLFRGWAMAEQGRVAEVIDEVRQTYHFYTSNVGGLAQTYAAILVCGVFRRAGHIDEALDALNNVLAVARNDQCRELAYEPELLRLKAELLAERGTADDGQVRALLLEAVERGRERGLHHLALRAATALSTFLSQRGLETLEGAALVAECRQALESSPPDR
ncbi:MAG: AAA family ATPase [Gemmatimonadetes bacterium]|nr:AAA family ATPase [Gemmatimonadota bacterium]